ncbi:MAG: DUF1800 domain-containing protein [Anaerolineae bacterium]|jgi:hypothetical protein|nr:DUF1800 domain-containing protein [Anaerolineae bacterium]
MHPSRRDLFNPLRWASSSSAALPPSRSVSSDPGLHLLNRLSYGALPEEVARLREIGADAYLDEQLAPDTLDDPAGDDVMRALPILSLDRRGLHSLGFDGRVGLAVLAGMVGRAVHSRRQLYERMVEFWTDHFNVPATDLMHDAALMHETVIRQHALGRFRDLVIGTAQSPAMLTYLDQTYSTKEHPNENYARELLELHTLGVDGGYTEQDVKETARALTGWTVNNATDSGFYFDASIHDTEPKTILGHTFPAGRGIEDGLHLLGLVVNHPETARYLCYKLCVRFVSDTPPDSLVAGAAQVWQDSGGQIVPVLRHIFQSPEFMASVGQKLRRPLDFFIGALRVTGTRSANDWMTYGLLEELAQVPYSWAAPDGYPDTAEAWLSSSGLLARWNVAMALTHSAYSDPESGMTNRLDQFIGTPETVGALVSEVATRVFGTPDIPLDEAAVFIDYASDGAGADAPVTPRLRSAKLGTLFGLMLASPLYQWR